MRALTKSVFIALAMGLISSFTCNAEAGQSDEERIKAEIMKVHDAMKAAAIAGNADALYSHVSTNLNEVIIQDGRLSKSRNEAIALSRRDLSRATNLTYQYDHTHITPLSPTLVLFVGDGNASATRPNGKEQTFPFAETLIFTLEDDKWKVLHAHRSTRPQGR